MSVKIHTLFSNQFFYFADNLQLGVIIFQQGFVKYCNQAFSDLIGYSKEEIIKMKKNEVFDLIHPEDLSKFFENLNIDQQEKILLIRYRVIRKDGKIIKVEQYHCPAIFNNKPASLSSFISRENIYRPMIIKSTVSKLVQVEFNPKFITYLNENNIDYQVFEKTTYREET